MKSIKEINGYNSDRHIKNEVDDIIKTSMNEMRNEILELLYNPLDDYYGMMNKEKEKLIQDIKNIKIW